MSVKKEVCILEEALCIFQGVQFKPLVMDFMDWQFLSVKVCIACLSTLRQLTLLLLLLLEAVR